jgi:hypothetical protein
MAALCLVNTEEAGRHQGRNSKHSQTQLCEPDGKIRRPEGDSDGTSPKRNPGRWYGVAPYPRYGAPPWIEWRGTVRRRSRQPRNVTILLRWSVLVDLLARESVKVEVIGGGEASLLKESAAALGGREAREGKAYGCPGSLCRSKGIVSESEMLFKKHG